MDAFAVTMDVDVVTGHWLLPARAGYAEHETAFSHIPWGPEIADRALPNPLVSLFILSWLVVPFSPFPSLSLSYSPFRAKSLRRKAQREYSQRLSMGTLDPCRQPRETKPQVLPWRHADVVAKEARKRQGLEGQRKDRRAHLEQWSVRIYRSGDIYI